MALTREDEDQLRLLSIFHYVVAGLMALFSMLPLLHFAIGAAIVFAPESLGNTSKGGPPPDFFGWFFMAFAGAFIALGLTIATCIALSGRFIARRRHYLFCLVVAGVATVMCMPFGTILGIFTIIVLMRASVKEAFGYPGSA